MAEDVFWLVFDDVGAGFAGLDPSRVTPRVSMRLSSPQLSAGASAWLRYDDLTVDRAQCWDQDGALLADVTFPARPVRSSLPYDTREVADLPEPSIQAALDSGRLSPCYLVVERQGSDIATAYCCSRIRASGLVFSRFGQGPRGSAPDVVAAAVADDPSLLRRFSDESEQTTRFDDEIEIELKLTLTGDTRPWDLARDLAAVVQDRGLPGFIPDVGNEFQRWSYEQHTYEVSGRPEETGYVAFMTTQQGRYHVKYKFFVEDALRRVELFDEDLDLRPADFEPFLREKLPDVRFRALPHLTRSRFDVNVESEETGHYYGLEADEVWANGQVLRQLEIEYHKSRACLGVVPETIEPGLLRLTNEAEALLGGWDVAFDRGYLSKLTFLRQAAGDLVAVSPES